ncbi:glycosyl hydrolase family 18 protein [Virgibacillus senegalensis]|uniref:glycosyl hydrolase family 18 protein n=1 Tax=Virgibacillus senegalensis TaxID=1499679 RepID=UPI00069ED507|nr:glycosyl hydrolase family 18 protein [Virgibacillus senegalensis]
MGIHIVKPGDTLWSIAASYRSTIEMITHTNGLENDLLMPGLALYIPTSAELPVRYTRIQPGDTLAEISKRWQSSVPLLLYANPAITSTNLPIGQVLAIPSPLRYPIRTLGFIDAFDPPSLSDLQDETGASLTYAAVFTYGALPGGGLTDLEDEQLIDTLIRNRIEPLMVVSNYEEGSFSPELAGNVLKTEQRSVLITHIIRVMREKGYKGVSLDFEFIPPASRKDFTAFVQELKAAMGDLLLHVNVFSKTEDAPDNPLSGAFDYQAIGESADLVTVLTYDYGYAAGQPDPIAPINWMEDIVRYATSLIPSPKLTIAIALFGYDWPGTNQQDTDGMAIALSARNAQQQALDNYAVIQYDQEAQAPFYTYSGNGNRRTVWFEDIRSLSAKYRLMEAYQLGGAAYWRLGYAFPQNWAYLRKNTAIWKEGTI